MVPASPLRRFRPPRRVLIAAAAFALFFLLDAGYQRLVACAYAAVAGAVFWRLDGPGKRRIAAVAVAILVWPPCWVTVSLAIPYFWFAPSLAFITAWSLIGATAACFMKDAPAPRPEGGERPERRLNPRWFVAPAALVAPPIVLFIAASCARGDIGTILGSLWALASAPGWIAMRDLSLDRLVRGFDALVGRFPAVAGNAETIHLIAYSIGSCFLYALVGIAIDVFLRVPLRKEVPGEGFRPSMANRDPVGGISRRGRTFTACGASSGRGWVFVLVRRASIARIPHGRLLFHRYPRAGSDRQNTTPRPSRTRVGPRTTRRPAGANPADAGAGAG